MIRRGNWAGLGCAMLLLLSTAARADDRAALTSDEAADRVLVALAMGDQPALAVLAGRRDPDPWRVADVLARREEYDAALAYAHAAHRKEVERLPTYIELRRKAGSDDAAQALLNQVLDAGDAAKWSAVIAATDVLPRADSVTDLRIRWERGMALRSAQRFGDSAKAFAQAAAEAKHLGWPRFAGDSLHESGASAYQSANWRGAQDAWVARLAVVKQLGYAPSRASARNNLGMVSELLGDLDASVRHYEQALSMLKAPEDAARTAPILNNLGVVYDTLGRYADAQSQYEKALAIQRRTLDQAGQAATLHNLGALERKMGRVDDAIARYQAALVLERARSNERGIAVTLHNLGLVQIYGGALAAGVSSLAQALRLARKAKDRHREGKILTSIGSAQLDQALYVDALRNYRSAERIRRDIGDLFGLAETIGLIGETFRRQGQFPEALAQFAAAQKILTQAPLARLSVNVLTDESRTYFEMGAFGPAIVSARGAVDLAMRMARGLGEGEGAGARDEHASAFHVGMLAAFAANDLSSLCWFIEQGRAGSLREGLATRAALQNALLDPDLRAELHELQRREQESFAQYGQAIRVGHRKRIRLARQAYDEVRARGRTLDARIQRDAKASASILLPAPHDLKRIQKDLRPGEALVLYGFALEEALALVVRADGARDVSLGPTRQFTSAIGSLLSNAEKQIEPRHIETLRKLAADKLALPDDVTRVLVSPTGRLGYVPFALLFPKRVVRYTPSGTLLGLQRAKSAPGGRDVLALGDVDYSGSRLQPLPATRAEVEAVGTVRLLGANATETGLHAALVQRKRWRALHFACHGLIDAQRPMYSSLALTPDAKSDGRLTCLEVLRMRIPADLVVLSACDTAKGKVYKTEGIVGLARAFMFAGAPRVLCSLWKVDDEATKALMVKFYALWGSGTGPAEALREAQAFVRRPREVGTPPLLGGLGTVGAEQWIR